jgi:hypothetical protein
MTAFYERIRMIHINPKSPSAGIMIHNHKERRAKAPQAITETSSVIRADCALNHNGQQYFRMRFSLPYLIVERT